MTNNAVVNRELSVEQLKEQLRRAEATSRVYETMLGRAVEELERWRSGEQVAEADWAHCLEMGVDPVLI